MNGLGDVAYTVCFGRDGSDNQFLIVHSTFCLDTKSGAKKSRTAQSLRVPVRANAQQHSDTLIMR